MGDFDAYVKCQERVSEVFQVRFRSKNVLFGNIINLCPHYTYVHNFTGSLKCMSDVADRGLCDISIDA